MTRDGPRMSDWGLERVKRDWVPDWLWRAFCVGNLATFTPWREILTRSAPVTLGPPITLKEEK